MAARFNRKKRKSASCDVPRIVESILNDILIINLVDLLRYPTNDILNDRA